MVVTARPAKLTYQLAGSDGLGRLDPVAFKTAFTAWATAALPALADEQVCVDGKAVRGSRDGTTGAIHWVSTFAGRAR